MASYDLGSPSDMKRLQKDMEAAIKQKAKESISEGTIPVECPKCKEKFNAPPGISTCPSCGSQIDLHINFDF